MALPKFPQAVFVITDGDSTKNITFNGTDDIRDNDDDTKALGVKFAAAVGGSFVKAYRINSTDIVSND